VASKRTIFLVSCVSKKLPQTAAARDLYQSNWFRLARSYVESRGRPWYILSAEYGLLRPEAVVRPYEKTLNRMSVRERRAWAEAVLSDLRGLVGPGDKVVILAGKKYREFLVPRLEGLGCAVEEPLARLRIGEQKAWLKAKTHGPD